MWGRDKNFQDLMLYELSNCENKISLKFFLLTLQRKNPQQNSCTLHNCNVHQHQPDLSIVSWVHGKPASDVAKPKAKKVKQRPTPLLTILNQDKGRKRPSQWFQKPKLRHGRYVLFTTRFNCHKMTKNRSHFVKGNLDISTWLTNNVISWIHSLYTLYSVVQ